MASVNIYFVDTTGQTLYAYPIRTTAGATYSLADWATYRVLCTEAAAPNAGRYTAVLSDDNSEYALFIGATQPTDWDQKIDVQILLVSSTINVVPFDGETPDRVNGTTITVFQDEEVAISVTLADTDLTGLELVFVIEDQERADVLVIDNADITVSEGTFTVTIPDSITSDIGIYRWALRDISGTGNTVMGHGVFGVVYAANDDV